MIDLTKPLRTKIDHIPVTILTTKGRGVRPVIGYLDRPNRMVDCDIPSMWGIDGDHYLAWMVLENVPSPPVKRWLLWIEHTSRPPLCLVYSDPPTKDDLCIRTAWGQIKKTVQEIEYVTTATSN